jgi:hypothetical protein
MSSPAFIWPAAPVPVGASTLSGLGARRPNPGWRGAAAQRQRLHTHLVALDQPRDHLVVVDVEALAEQVFQEERLRHQRRRREAVGLNLLAVGSLGRAVIAEEDHVFIDEQRALRTDVQGVVPKLMCQGEALSIRVVVGVDADDDLRTLLKQHPRDIVRRLHVSDLGTDVLGQSSDVDRSELLSQPVFVVASSWNPFREDIANEFGRGLAWHFVLMVSDSDGRRRRILCF